LLGGSEALQDRREAGEDGVEVGAEAVDREVARKMQGSTPKIRMVSRFPMSGAPGQRIPDTGSPALCGKLTPLL
jgi:hypothetical protein